MLQIWSFLCLFWHVWFFILLYVCHQAVMIRSSIWICVTSTSLTKFESCSAWQNLQVWCSFCVSSIMRIQVAWQSWWWFRCLVFESRKRKRLCRHQHLVWKFNICEINGYVKQSENSSFKPSTCWFFPMAGSLIFWIKNLC